MSTYDDGAYDEYGNPLPAVTEEQRQWVAERVAALVGRLYEADVEGTMRPGIDWLRQDLEREYAQAIVDETLVYLEPEVDARVEWVVPQLSTPRRRAHFANILAYTQQGDVWGWLQRWEGINPDHVFEGAGGEAETEGAPDAAPAPTVYSVYGEDTAATETVYQVYGEDTSTIESVYSEYKDE